MALATLAGCAGEPVRPPEIPATDRYTTTDLPAQAAVDVHGGGAQTFEAGMDVPAQWWTLFQSPALDALVRQAIEASPTLAQARARLTQAQEDASAFRGGTQLPRVDANLAAYKVDLEPDSIGAPNLPVDMPLNLYLATIGVSYTFAIVGANRHGLEALRAAIDHRQYEVEAARLMLAGNVVTAAIREASLREQIARTREIIAAQENQLMIVEKLEQLGTAAGVDVIAQRLELAQTRAQLPGLESQLEQLRHRLAVYTGQPPGAAKLPEFHLADLKLPQALPLTVPSKLAQQRPDIRGAEAMLRQAGAGVGVATANMFPQITLSATGGSLAGSGGELLESGSDFYLLGASLVQPLFHGGELRAKRRAAVAAYEQAAAAYRETVLQGLQNVADVLRALEADSKILAARAEAAQHARRYHEIVAARYEAGGTSYFLLLDARKKLHGALIDETRAVADRYADSAALFQSLGGGWWNAQK
jgi:NodT family efflux transporter outer membrane factor (OMF) lipoprotein